MKNEKSALSPKLGKYPQMSRDYEYKRLVFVPLDDLEATAGLLKKCFNGLLGAHSAMTEGVVDQNGSE